MGFSALSGGWLEEKRASVLADSSKRPERSGPLPQAFASGLLQGDAETLAETIDRGEEEAEAEGFE